MKFESAPTITTESVNLLSEFANGNPVATFVLAVGGLMFLCYKIKDMI